MIPNELTGYDLFTSAGLTGLAAEKESVLATKKAEKEAYLGKRKQNQGGNLEDSVTVMEDGSVESNKNKIWNNMSSAEYQTAFGIGVRDYALVPSEDGGLKYANSGEKYTGPTEYAYMGYGKESPDVFKFGIARGDRPVEARYDPARGGWASGPQGIDNTNMKGFLLPAQVAVTLEALGHGRQEALDNRMYKSGDPAGKTALGSGYTEYYNKDSGFFGDSRDDAKVDQDKVQQQLKGLIQQSEQINPRLGIVDKKAYYDKLQEAVKTKEAQNMGFGGRALNTLAAFPAAIGKELVVDSADWVGETLKRQTDGLIGWDLGDEKTKMDNVSEFFGYNEKVAELGGERAKKVATKIYEKAFERGEGVELKDVGELIKIGLETPEMLTYSLGYVASLMVGTGKFTKAGKAISDIQKLEKAGEITKDAAKLAVANVKAAEAFVPMMARIGGQNAGFATVVAGDVNDQIDTFIANNNGEKPSVGDITRMMGVATVMTGLDKFVDLSLLRGAKNELAAAAKLVPDNRALEIATKVAKGTAMLTAAAGVEAAQEYSQTMGELFNKQFNSEKYGDDAKAILTSKGNVIEGISAAGMGAAMGAQMKGMGMIGSNLQPIASAVGNAVGGAIDSVMPVSQEYKDMTQAGQTASEEVAVNDAKTEQYKENYTKLKATMGGNLLRQKLMDNGIDINTLSEEDIADIANDPSYKADVAKTIMDMFVGTASQTDKPKESFVNLMRGMDAAGDTELANSIRQSIAQAKNLSTEQVKRVYGSDQDFLNLMYDMGSNNNTLTDDDIGNMVTNAQQVYGDKITLEGIKELVNASRVENKVYERLGVTGKSQGEVNQEAVGGVKGFQTYYRNAAMARAMGDTQTAEKEVGKLRNFLSLQTSKYDLFTEELTNLETEYNRAVNAAAAQIVAKGKADGVDISIEKATDTAKKAISRKGTWKNNKDNNSKEVKYPGSKKTFTIRYSDIIDNKPFGVRSFVKGLATEVAVGKDLLAAYETKLPAEEITIPASTNTVPTEQVVTSVPIQTTPTKNFLDIIDTDEVYKSWSNLQDGTDRSVMRDQISYAAKTYGPVLTSANRAEVKAELTKSFKWFKAATDAQREEALDSLINTQKQTAVNQSSTEQVSVSTAAPQGNVDTSIPDNIMDEEENINSNDAYAEFAATLNEQDSSPEQAPTDQQEDDTVSYDNIEEYWNSMEPTEVIYEAESNSEVEQFVPPTNKQIEKRNELFVKAKEELDTMRKELEEIASNFDIEVAMGLDVDKSKEKRDKDYERVFGKFDKLVKNNLFSRSNVQYKSATGVEGTFTELFKIIPTPLNMITYTDKGLTTNEKEIVDQTREAITRIKNWSTIAGAPLVMGMPNNEAVKNNPAFNFLGTKPSANLVIALRTAVDNYISNKYTDLRTAPEDMKELADAAGAKTAKKLTESAKEKFATGGIQASIAADDIGRDIMKLLGLSAQKDTSKTEIDRLSAGLGLLAVSIMSELGYIKSVRGTELTPESSLYEIVADNTNGLVVKNGVFIKEEFGINQLNQVRQNIEVMKYLSPDGESHAMPSFEAPTGDRVVRIQRESFMKPTKEHIAVVNKLESVGWKLHEGGMKMLARIFGENWENSGKLKNLLGMPKETDDLETVYKSATQAKSDAGKKRQVLDTLNGLKALQGEAGDKPFYYKWFIGANWRFHIKNTVGNMQSDSGLARWLVQPADASWVEEIKRIDVVNFEKGNSRSIENMLFGIIQGLDGVDTINGIKVPDVEKDKYEAVIEAAKQILEAPLSSLVVEVRDARKLKHPGQAAMALYHIEQYQISDVIINSMPREIDGKTNGFGHKMLQLPIMEIDTIKSMLNAVGILVNEDGNGVDSITDVIAAKKYGDVYQKIGFGFYSEYREVLGRLGYTIEDIASLVGDGFGFVDPSGTETGVKGDLRSFVKGAATEVNYSANIYLSAKKRSVEFADSVMNNIAGAEDGNHIELISKVVQLASKALNSNRSANYSDEHKAIIKLYIDHVKADNKIQENLRKSLNDSKANESIYEVAKFVGEVIVSRPLQASLHLQFGAWETLNESINSGMNWVFEVFNYAYKKEVEEIETAFGRKITAEEQQEIMEKLAHLIPSVETINSVGNKEKVNLLKVGTIGSSGKENVRIKKSQNLDKSKGGRGIYYQYLTEDVLDKSFLEPGASTTPKTVHSSDATNMGEAVLKIDTPIIPIHDAAVFGPNVDNVAKVLNESFLEMNMQYSMIESYNKSIEVAYDYVQKMEDREASFDLLVKELMPKTMVREAITITDVRADMKNQLEMIRTNRAIIRGWDLKVGQFVDNYDTMFEHKGEEAIKKSQEAESEVTKDLLDMLNELKKTNDPAMIAKFEEQLKVCKE